MSETLPLPIFVDVDSPSLVDQVDTNTSDITDLESNKLNIDGTQPMTGDLDMNLNNVNNINVATLQQQTGRTPSNPIATQMKLYFKSDGLLYSLDSFGIETEVGGKKTDGSEWNFLTILTDTITSGNFNFDNAIPLFTTTIRVSVDDCDGISRIPFLRLVKIGNSIVLTNADESNIKVYKVNGVIDETAVRFSFTVVLTDQTTTASFSNNEKIRILLDQSTNPFDQSLNTTDDVQFSKTTIQNSTSAILDVDTATTRFRLLTSEPTRTFSLSNDVKGAIFKYDETPDIFDFKKQMLFSDGNVQIGADPGYTINKVVGAGGSTNINTPADLNTITGGNYNYLGEKITGPTPRSTDYNVIVQNAGVLPVDPQFSISGVDNNIKVNLPVESNQTTFTDTQLITKAGVSAGFVAKTASVNNPTPADSDYNIGDLWINEALDLSFVIVDNTPGFAIWRIFVWNQDLNTGDYVKFESVDTPLVINTDLTQPVRIGGNEVQIGNLAGLTNQAADSIAIGFQAGQTNQLASAIAMGLNAGNNNQGAGAIAIGNNSGIINQGAGSISLGRSSGQTNQASGSIAIGISADNSAVNSICLNASGVPLDANQSGFFVKPIAQGSENQTLQYNNSTGQIVHNSTLRLADTSTPLAGTRVSGEGQLYKKIGDDGIFWLPDIAGVEVDLTGGGVSPSIPNIIINPENQSYVSYQSTYLIRDGAVYGADSGNVNGNFPSATLQKIVGMPIGVTAIALGGHGKASMMFLGSDARVYFKGNTDTGAVGNNNIDGFYRLRPMLTAFDTPIENVTKLVSSNYYLTNSITNYVISDGDIYATGYNTNGQLGDGTTTNNLQFFQIVPSIGLSSPLLSPIVDAWTGTSGTSSAILATDAAGRTFAWGNNNNSKLGLVGTIQSIPVDITFQMDGGSSYPVQVQFNSGGTGSADSTNILLNNGKIFGCGYNTRGNLGTGDTLAKTTFTQEALGATNWTQIQLTGSVSGALSTGMFAINSLNQLYFTGNNTGNVAGTAVISAGATVSTLTRIDIGEEFENKVAKIFSLVGTNTASTSTANASFLITTEGKVYSVGSASVLLCQGGATPFNNWREVRLGEVCVDIRQISNYDLNVGWASIMFLGASGTLYAGGVGGYGTPYVAIGQLTSGWTLYNPSAVLWPD